MKQFVLFWFFYVTVEDVKITCLLKLSVGFQDGRLKKVLIV